MRTLHLLDVHRTRECLQITCALDDRGSPAVGSAAEGPRGVNDDLQFHTSIWYEDVDLHELAARFGEEIFERICVHIALFQINAVASLRPDAIALGRYAKYATRELVELWSTVFRHVWAQWRWEHDLPDYLGPKFVDAPAAAATAGAPAPTSVTPGATELLAYCGGGKDSLVALRLLERAGQRFATLGYSHSIYGAAEPQHALLDRVGGATARIRAERQWIYDDFLDSPVVRLRPNLGVGSLLAAETPASVFAALPIALARGYTSLVVAHERSANAANLIWDATGEPVNHQWGKGWAAERLLDGYVRTHLVANVRYFSLLAPIHDEVIFELLARDAALAPLTHSCNVRKPWCGECAKCAYVWLQFAAHLPADIVRATFGEPLSERPANERWFRELLGLAEHSPFECVGSPAEARLALALARAAGARGARLDAYAAQVGAIDVPALAAGFVELGREHNMPPALAEAILPLLADAARTAAQRLGVGPRS